MTSDTTPDLERFDALISALQTLEPNLSSIGAALVAALAEELAADSRSAANGLGLAHALVLREVRALEALGMLAIARRDARTMRTFYALGESGRLLLHRAAHSK